MANNALFRAKAPGIMAILMRDFDLTVADAAAILGNLGHESGGFAFLQEKKPLIPGSAGGYGWAQWTGARRREFTQWCARHALDPASDDANMGFLLEELRSSYPGAITAVKNAPLGEGADALRRKVIAFELTFERAAAQYKHYDSRVQWANIAFAAYHAAEPVPERPVEPRDEAEPQPSADAPVGEPKLSSIEIKGAQRALHDLKFYEVGLPDGTIGSRTIAAVAAFRHDRGLAGAPLLDRALIAELERAQAESWTRPIDPARAEGIPEDSRIVASAERQAALSGTTGGTIVTGGVLAWLTRKFDAVQLWLDPLAPYVKPFASLFLEYWWAFLGAGLAYLAIEQAQIRKARIEDHREGKTT